MGVCGSARATGGGVRVPLRRDGRFANRPYDGEWGMRRGLGWGCPARRPSGYRLSPVRRCGCGVRRETETPLCLAPALDSRFRGKDDGGVRAGKCWRSWGGEGPAAAVRAVREPPLRRVGGVGDATGVWVGVPRPACLWVHACAGMTRVGVCGAAGADGGGGPPSSALRTGFDRLRANGLGKRAYYGE